MGETPDRIEAHIEATRQALYGNMQELERKVRSIADWRAQIGSHPKASLSLAAGAGMLIAQLVLGRKSS